MKKHTGELSRVTLSFDMTFFALVRLALTDTEIGIRKRRCAVHPLQKRSMMDDNSELAYTSYVSALLSAYKVYDTVSDEKGMKRFGAFLARPYADQMKKRALRRVNELEHIVADGMVAITSLENEHCPTPDLPADAFGKMLSELLSVGLSGGKALIAKEIGLHTGRFVYLIDAASDYMEDKIKGSYNPFRFAFDSDEEMERFRKESLRGILALEADAILRAVRLIEGEGQYMLLDCIENIITDGMESALSLAVGKEESYDK